MKNSMVDSQKRIMLMLAIALTAIVFLALTREPDAEPKYVRVGDTVFVSGQISSLMESYIGSLDLKTVKNLEIDSDGGHVSSALTIADMIAKNSINVIVRRRCLSACASIILVSGKNRYALPGSIIAFHSSQFGLFNLHKIAQKNNQNVPGQSADVEFLAKEEVKLYRTMGVNAKLLATPYLFRGHICYLATNRNSREEKFSIQTQYNAFAPSKEYLNLYNMKILGHPNEMFYRDKNKSVYYITIDNMVRTFTTLDPNASGVNPDYVDASFNGVRIRSCVE